MKPRLATMWHDQRRLLAVFLLALVIRVLYALIAPQVDPFLRADPLHGDAGSYDRIARNLLAGHGFGETVGTPTAFWPPLYPAFLAAVYSVFGYNLLLARVVQAVLGALAVAATFQAARSLFDLRVATWAGLGMAFYPHLIYFGAWLIAEPLYMALLALILVWAVRVQQHRRLRDFVGLGVLLGLATLAKPATLMLLPLMLIWGVLAFRSQSMSRRVGQTALLFAVTLLSILPWTVRNYRTFGEVALVSTNGGYTFYGANNADAFGGHREGFPPRLTGLTEPAADREYYRQGLTWITQHPLDFVELTQRKLTRLLSPVSVASWETDYPLPYGNLVTGLYLGFFALALVGISLSLRRWHELLILYLLIGRVLIGTVLFYGDARYTLPMVPALVVFAGVSLARLLDGVGAWQAPVAIRRWLRPAHRDPSRRVDANRKLFP